MVKPVVLPVYSPEDNHLRISEIFFSIQGESTHAGWPCIMVRLTGCNLRCRWCDTEYSFSGGESMSLDEIVAAIQRYPSRRVELTGGEPLLQKNTPRLAERLLSAGYSVLCETSGERDISVLPSGVKRIMDIKPPGSGESHRNRWENLMNLCNGDEVKFVCTDRRDFDWMLGVVEKYQLVGRCPVLVSPAYQQLAGHVLAEWLLASGLDARLNLQLHKTLWGEEPGR
ncbi:MAG: radical SAM protein [Myxococcales bacterium]|nr:radical SAM protein [Myxococcales bacterium]